MLYILSNAIIIKNVQYNHIVGGVPIKTLEIQ